MDFVLMKKGNNMDARYKMKYIPVCYTEEIKDANEAEDIIRKMLETSMYKEQIKIPYTTLHGYYEGEDDGK